MISPNKNLAHGRRGAKRGVGGEGGRFHRCHLVPSPILRMFSLPYIRHCTTYAFLGYSFHNP